MIKITAEFKENEFVMRQHMEEQLPSPSTVIRCMKWEPPEWDGIQKRHFSMRTTKAMKSPICL